MTYPSLVYSHKKPNTEIKKKKGKFYLYEVSSRWDKQKGRAQKVTGAYLGRITEQEFIPKHRTYRRKPLHQSSWTTSISVKELGASHLLAEHLGQ